MPENNETIIDTDSLLPILTNMQLEALHYEVKAELLKRGLYSKKKVR